MRLPSGKKRKLEDRTGFDHTNAQDNADKLNRRAMVATGSYRQRRTAGLGDEWSSIGNNGKGNGTGGYTIDKPGIGRGSIALKEKKAQRR